MNKLCQKVITSKVNTEEISYGLLPELLQKRRQIKLDYAYKYGATVVKRFTLEE